MKIDWSTRRVGWVVKESGCHIWTGARDRKGYGVMRVGDRIRFVHRVRYEQEVGVIPDGMVLDHFLIPGRCSPACCNPAHVRPVTIRENTLRGGSPSAWNAAKETCGRGHELEGGNVMDLGDGKRYCRACRVERSRRWRAEHRGGAQHLP